MAEKADRLADYRGKRDATATPEPAGSRARKRSGTRRPKAPRFVIQQHDATRLHWDLRFERDDVAVSFAVPNGLPLAPKDNRLAVPTEDHPLEYLEFHGEIPAGNYGAGTMTIWDHGTYEVLKWEPRKIEVHLHGERLDARYALFPLARRGDSDPDWMIHRMDPPADPADAVPLPEPLAPMLATAGPLPPAGESAGWAFEIKWDGVRALVYSEPGSFTIRARRGTDVTRRYPELHRLSRALGHHRAVIDGEVVSLGEDGRPSFAALQSRMHLEREPQIRRLAAQAPVTYIAFDLLWLDGHPLLAEPYAERRELLTSLLNPVPPGARWQVPDHVVGDGEALVEAARSQDLEGVMAKRLDAPYEPGRRTSAWRKVKLTGRDDFTIAGWIPGTGKRRERIGALVLGTPGEDGALRFAGRVGTGFTERELDRLAAALGPLERATSPLAPIKARGAAAPPRTTVWVEPELQCEVEYREWTPDGLLRHPSYKGLADAPAAADPAAPHVVARTAKSETLEIGGREVRLSNPDKVLYPETGFTKRDLVAYFAAAAPVLLRHAGERQLTLKRYPDGVSGQFFFEKNAPSHRPDWVPTSGGYVVVREPATLAWLANLADIELHTPLARAETPETPDLCVFDLDPGEGAGLIECATVARWLRAMLEGLGLRSVVKTSGSKGIQVYVPLGDPEASFAQTKTFSRTVAELLAAEAPELVVARQAKTIRGGRVLVDWGQNDTAKTTICAYSPRAMPVPSVSTPLRWDEIDAAVDAHDDAGLRFTTSDVLRRIEAEGDLFAGDGPPQSLPG